MTAQNYPHATASAAFEELLVARKPRPSLLAIVRRWLRLD
jgi:hypothetical protein